MGYKIKMLNLRLWSILYSMQFKRVFFLCSFLFLGSLSAFSQLGGTSIYNFMEIPSSARTSALGGMASIVRDGDLSAADQNPSFLDSSVSGHMILTYSPYYAGINFGYVAYAQNIEDIGTFDAGIKYLDYGTFTQADVAGNVTGTFTAGDCLFNVGYGRPLKDSCFTIGANLKVISSYMNQYYSWGAAVDLGASYASRNQRFFAGLAVQNIGTQLRYYTPGNPEPIQFDINGGIAGKLKHAPFRFSLGLQHLQKWDLTYLDPTDTQTVNPLTGQSITQSTVATFFDKLMRHVVPGVEVLLGNSFSIRVGFNYDVRQELALTSLPGVVGLSAGFGITIYKFQLNYAWYDYNLSGGLSTFTIGFNLNDFVPHKRESLYVAPPEPERPIMPISH
jgi:hypothetical protein